MQAASLVTPRPSTPVRPGSIHLPQPGCPGSIPRPDQTRAIVVRRPEGCSAPAPALLLPPSHPRSAVRSKHGCQHHVSRPPICLPACLPRAALPVYSALLCSALLVPLSILQRQIRPSRVELPRSPGAPPSPRIRRGRDRRPPLLSWGSAVSTRRCFFRLHLAAQHFPARSPFGVSTAR